MSQDLSYQRSQLYKKEETLVLLRMINLIAYETTYLRNEVGDKKKKSLALKSQEEEDSESENETDLSDEIALWSRRIARMMKKRGKQKKWQT